MAASESMKGRRSFALIALSAVLSFVVALGASMAVARFAPFVEPERLVAGALTFPIWWTLCAVYALLGRRPARRLAALTTLAVALGGAIVVL